MHSKLGCMFPSGIGCRGFLQGCRCQQGKPRTQSPGWIQHQLWSCRQGMDSILSVLERGCTCQEHNQYKRCCLGCCTCQQHMGSKLHCSGLQPLQSMSQQDTWYTLIHSQHHCRFQLGTGCKKGCLFKEVCKGSTLCIGNTYREPGAQQMVNCSLIACNARKHMQKKTPTWETVGACRACLARIAGISPDFCRVGPPRTLAGARCHVWQRVERSCSTGGAN